MVHHFFFSSTSSTLGRAIIPPCQKSLLSQHFAIPPSTNTVPFPPPFLAICFPKVNFQYVAFTFITFALLLFRRNRSRSPSIPLLLSSWASQAGFCFPSLYVYGEQSTHNTVPIFLGERPWRVFFLSPTPCSVDPRYVFLLFTKVFFMSARGSLSRLAGLPDPGVTDIPLQFI